MLWVSGMVWLPGTGKMTIAQGKAAMAAALGFPIGGARTFQSAAIGKIGPVPPVQTLFPRDLSIELG